MHSLIAYRVLSKSSVRSYLEGKQYSGGSPEIIYQGLLVYIPSIVFPHCDGCIVYQLAGFHDPKYCSSVCQLLNRLHY